jgi:hypothetical protein
MLVVLDALEKCESLLQRANSAAKDEGTNIQTRGTGKGVPGRQAGRQADRDKMTFYWLWLTVRARY